jgi:hypothetical protein
MVPEELPNKAIHRIADESGSQLAFTLGKIPQENEGA